MFLRKKNWNDGNAFLKVLSNIRYLARQGLPLRGYGDPKTLTESESNFVQLMKLRDEDDSRKTGWLEKKWTNTHPLICKIK